MIQAREAVAEELSGLYRAQRDSEHADRDGRVTDRVLWRQTIARRAERIRQLEQQLKTQEQAA
jgi:hypothetical protein